MDQLSLLASSFLFLYYSVKIINLSCEFISRFSGFPTKKNNKVCINTFTKVYLYNCFVVFT